MENKNSIPRDIHRRPAVKQEQAEWEDKMRQQEPKDIHMTDGMEQPIESHIKETVSHTTNAVQASEENKRIIESSRNHGSIPRDIHRQSAVRQEQEEWEKEMHQRPLHNEHLQSEQYGQPKRQWDPDINNLPQKNSDLSKGKNWDRSRMDICRNLNTEAQNNQKKFDFDAARSDGNTGLCQGDEFIKGRRFLTNSSEKIWRMEQRPLHAMSRLFMTYEQQSDMGRATSFYSENYLPVIKGTAALVRSRLAASNRAALMRDPEFVNALHILSDSRYGKQLHIPSDGIFSSKDVRILQRDLSNLLKSEGIGRFSQQGSFAHGQLLWAQLKGRFSTEELNALLYIFKKIAIADAINPRNLKMKVIFPLTLKARRYMRQDDTMKAMLLTAVFARHSKQILRNGLYVIGVAYRLARFIAYQATLLAAKAATAAANTKLAELLASKGQVPNIVINAAKNAQPNLTQAHQKSVQKRKDRLKNKNDRKTKWHDFTNKINPFRLLKAKLWNPAKEFATKGRYNPLRILGNLFKGLGDLVGTASSLFAIICCFLGVVIAAAVIIVIMNNVIISILDAYNFNNNEQKAKQACFDIVASCYKSQMEQVQNLGANGGYRQVRYVFNDRDDDPDNDHKTNAAYKNEFDYTETTNSTEMYSMAQVYFDFELSEADENDVVTYLQQLYNGSHIMETKEIKSTEKDENGNPKYVDLEVTLTTYYFDELFDCALVSSYTAGGESPIAGKSYDIPQDFKQAITYESTMSWLKNEVKVDSYQKMISLWESQGCPTGDASDGMETTPCLIVGGQKRYFCAIALHFGKHGDYVDAYLEDGSILPLILLDEKGCSDKKGYHNLTTCFMYNGFHYGHTVTPGDQSVCSVLEFMKSPSSPHLKNPSDYCTKLKPVAGSGSSSIKVTKLVNGGSYWENPNGPKYVNGDTSVVNNENANAKKYLSELQNISNYVKGKYSYVRLAKNSETSFENLKEKTGNGQYGRMNSSAPARWALQQMGLLEENAVFYGKNDGSFTLPKGRKKQVFKQKLSEIRTGGPVGMKFQDAAASGKLQAGDIINLSSGSSLCTVVYAGTGSTGDAMVYDGGSKAGNYGGGCYVNYKKVNTEIQSILRWK